MGRSGPGRVSGPGCDAGCCSSPRKSPHLRHWVLHLVGLSIPLFLPNSYSAFRVQVKCPLFWESS